MTKQEQREDSEQTEAQRSLAMQEGLSPQYQGPLPRIPPFH